MKIDKRCTPTPWVPAVTKNLHPQIQIPNAGPVYISQNILPLGLICSKMCNFNFTTIRSLNKKFGGGILDIIDKDKLDLGFQR